MAIYYAYLFSALLFGCMICKMLSYLKRKYIPNTRHTAYALAASGVSMMMMTMVM